MDIYNIINKFDNKTLLRNIAIILFFIWIFSKICIGLNVVFGIFLAIVVIAYLYSKQETEQVIEADQFETKLSTIKPTLISGRQNEDIVDFLFSIQDFYIYNPQTYEEMIDNINAFYTVYDSLLNDEKFANYYYQIAESKKLNALNLLQSFIHNLPNEKLYTDKLDRAHERLETILNVYLNHLYDACDHNLIKNGYNYLTRHINVGPKEANTYDDTKYSFQFY